MSKKFIDLANLKSNLENFFSEIISPTFATKEEISEQLGSHTVKSDVPENAVFTDTIYDDAEIQKRISDNSYGEVAGGKNLLNPNKTIIGELMEGIVSSGRHYISDYISIKSDTSYSISNCTQASNEIAWYTSDKTYINRSFGTPVVSPSNASYVRIEYTDNINAQLEEGSVATEYEPYFPSNKMLAEEKADKSETTVNLLNPTLQTTTSNGVTCTNNGDGTYTLNGTATNYNATFDLSFSCSLNSSVKLLGRPKNIDGVMIQTMYNGSWDDSTTWDNTGNGAILSDASKINRLSLFVLKDKSVKNAIIKPMITTNLDATYDDFVSYTGDSGSLNGDVAQIKNDLSKLQDNVDSSDIQYSAYIKNANGDITPSAIISSPKINEAVSQINNNIGVLLQGHNEQKSKLDNLSASNAGAHNSVYRGKYLGNALTTEQKEQISAGTFNDLYIGDYWTIGGVNYRIAAFDYWLNSGDTNCTTHHVVIVPDSNLYTAKMNDTDITTGAYIGSEMYKTNLAAAKTMINNAFGSSHILSHREYLANATKSTTDPTYESAGSWYDSTVEIMNERMVHGADVYHNIEVNGAIPTNYTIDKSQLPLFALEPSRICNRAHWWLRDVVSVESFAFVYDNGGASYANASNSLGVRPVFAIKG